MSVIDDIVTQAMQRLEESTSSPQFWSFAELRPLAVEAMNEATLITGEPQVRQKTLFTLAANTTFFTLPSTVTALAVLRMEATGQIQKVSSWDLDRMTPGWQNDVGTKPDFWFPFGLTQFGIHPKLSAAVSCFITYVGQPVSTPRPFTGSEQVDFQEEYREAFIDYVVHMAALKEGTQEFQDSIKVYDRFIARMGELSRFVQRKSILRFSKTMGAPARISPVETR